MPTTLALALSLLLGSSCTYSPPGKESLTTPITLGNGIVRIDHRAFQGIDETAGERFASRTAATIAAVAQASEDRSVSVPSVWRVREVRTHPSYPVDTSDANFFRTPELRLVLLPSAAALAEHIPPLGPDTRIADLADRTPRAAATIFFEPGSTDESSALWMPTPDGFPQPFPGVNLHTKPWLTMGRLVFADPSAPTRSQTLSDRVEKTASRLGLHIENYLYTLPHNDVVSRVALCDADGGLTRAWHAFVLADAVAGRRTPEETIPGESPYTVPFESETHDPKLGDGYQLLRVPFANRYRGGGYIPGERITIDDSLATKSQGYVALVTQPESAPATPAYALVMDLDQIRAAAIEDRIECVAIIDTIDNDALETVLRTVLKPE
ncbi:MAG: hypothetical protein D6692_11875 [Planctomycetota bacterium]|nr:MAG: hypothetical protein D6692_11875 [Planctomycetota bacterium]